MFEKMWMQTAKVIDHAWPNLFYPSQVFCLGLADCPKILKFLNCFV